MLLIIYLNIKKNKTYVKNTYFIISDDMKKELTHKNINQYFSDITYYSTPTYTKKYKLFIIIGFDYAENKSILAAIILLENENVETFSQFLNF